MWPVNEVVREHDSLAEAIAMMSEKGLATLPVQRDDGRLEGTFVAREAIAAAGEGGGEATVASFARDDATVPAGQDLDAALKIVRSHHVNRLPVTENGTIVGMVSQGDLIAAAMLEELGIAVDQVSRTISPNDLMYHKTAAGYLFPGTLAVQLIRQCMKAVGTQEVRRVLDFGCGHGRVMRVMRAAFPDAQLIACDIDQDAVSFCAETFDAQPVLAGSDAAHVALDGTFDLIWAGSVLTHLDPHRWEPLLAMLARHLAPGATAAVTVNGGPMTEVWRTGKWFYTLPADELAKLIDAYREHGLGYRGYPDQDDYGLSVASMEKVAEIAARAGLRVAVHLEGAWAARQNTLGQDVVALVRDSTLR
jgi:CBS domain-containing protein/phospholipid N-methyltransferase